MKKVSLLRIFLRKAHSLLLAPLSFVALSLVVTDNLPNFHVDPSALLEADYSPRSRVLGLRENLEFQRFVFARTYYLVGKNQCSVKPELRSVIQDTESLH